MCIRDRELISESCDEKPVKLRLFLVAPAFCNNAKARANMAAFFDKHLNARTETSIGTGEAGLDALRAGSCDALITICLLYTSSWLSSAMWRLTSVVTALP